MTNSSRKDWSRFLEDARWAHRTAYRTSLGMSPYRIVFGKACHLPVEIKHRAYWPILRKEFRVGQKVLLFNSRLKLIVGKLHSRWGGPFDITNVFPFGAVELKDEHTDKRFVHNSRRPRSYWHTWCRIQIQISNFQSSLPTISTRSKKIKSQAHKAITKKVESNHPRRGQEGSGKTACRRIIYPISNSQWVSLVQVVPKMSQMIVMKIQHDELVTRKDHFPLPVIDQVLEKLAGKSHYYFLDGFSGYMQIRITPEDQHKTTFTCPFGTFMYTRMPFSLCNAPSTFQCCMTSIFSDFL
ncbi:hypothetical protein CR513_14455, partial [Mucuna pruriens]